MEDKALTPGTIVDRRYRVESLVGTGGTARVYQVFDQRDGHVVALKRPLVAALRLREDLLEREFVTLSQLSHPLIVRAYDYGVFDEVPYYTMELVSGESLRRLAPMNWRDVCVSLRDVASALAIVHSRRLVHRDVTVRNVFRTSDGRAKLLDFGSLCPVGVANDIAGTPPFVPPESLDGRPLDARADLFGLGAVAHFLLTGVHAYPAERLAELRDLWARPLPAPSTSSHEVPASLDALVLSLLDLNPLARPANAAEVFHRLTAIAGVPTSEEPEVARAYLASPTLVGRDGALKQFRRYLSRADSRRGGTVIVRGQSGLGRSRFLSTLLWECKLRGYAVSRPEEAVRDRDYVALVTELGRERPTVVAIDDVERRDPASLAMLARLSAVAPSAGLLVIASTELDAALPSLPWLCAGPRNLSLRLAPLDAAATSALVSSVFGDASRLDFVSDWVHRISEGSPRTALELLRHLVDSGAARYDEGAFVLPHSANDLALPASLEQALESRLRSLGADARSLAECLALTSESDPLVPSELAMAMGGAEQVRVAAAVVELVSAGVLIERGRTYSFVDRRMREVTARDTSPALQKEIHERLARTYGTGPNRSGVLAAHHLLEAGDPDAALRALLGFIESRSDLHTRGNAFIRSPDGTRLYERVFEWATASRAPVASIQLVGRSLLQQASVFDDALVRHAPAVLEPLERDSGLIHWERFADAPEPSERLRRCVTAAMERYTKAPDDGSVMHPFLALRELAVCVMHVIGVRLRQNDFAAVDDMIELVNRVRPVSPAADMVAMLCECAVRSIRGRSALDLRRQIVERTSRSVEGMDDVSRAGVSLLSTYYMALEEVACGSPLPRDRLLPFEEHEGYASLVFQVKMIEALFAGDQKSADKFRRARDLAMIGGADRERHLDISIIYEASAYRALGDLMGLKRLLSTFRERAARWPGWAADAQLVSGVCEALRGNFPAALHEFDRGLAVVGKARGRSTWVVLTTQRARALVRLGRAPEGLEDIRRADALIQDDPFYPILMDQMEVTRALCEAHSGHGASALARAEGALARAEHRQTTAASLVELLAVTAETAFAVGDVAEFEALSERIARIAERLKNPAFATRHADLTRLIPRGPSARPPSDASGVKTVAIGLAARVRSELDPNRPLGERSGVALGLIASHAEVSEAFLFLNGLSGLRFAASRGQGPMPVTLRDAASAWVHTWHDDVDGAVPTPSSTNFEFVSITAVRGANVIVVGVVALSTRERAARPIPPHLLESTGEYLLEAAEVLSPEH